MAVGAVNSNQLALVSNAKVAQGEGPVQAKHSKVSFKQKPDTVELGYEAKAKGRRKFGTALVSLCPGLGQVANGQFGKAILTGLGIGAGLTAHQAGAVFALQGKKIGGAIGMYAGLALAAGTYIWSIVDSVKNAAKNVDVVPKYSDIYLGDEKA